MNTLASRVRSSLTIKTLSMLMFIKWLVHHLKNSVLHYMLDHGKGHHHMTVRLGRENECLMMNVTTILYGNKT